MGTRLFFSLLICAAIAGTLSCGGGGGGDGAPGDGAPSDGGDPGITDGTPALFTGGYWHSEMRIHASPLTVTGVWGAVNADGVGEFINQVRSNSNGDATNSPFTRTDAYTVTPTRAIRFANIGGDAYAYGGITSAGDLAVLAKFPDGIIPGLQVHTRMSGTFSTTDLDGAWHGCDFQYGVNLDVFLGGAGAWSFDNVGNYTMQGVTNLDGNATNPYDWGGGTFTVASEGQVQCTRPDGQKTLGQLSPDKRFLALSGAMADNDDPKLHILVRQADGTLTAVSAQGIYRALCLFYSPTRDDFASGRGTAQFDGVGNYTLELDLNWSAGSTATLAVSGTYAVAGNGRVTITESNAGAAQYQGGLAQDGRYAVLGGGVSDGSNPAIFFLLK